MTKNQIPYDNTVEVRNRFKGLDLIDRVPDELWMEGQKRSIQSAKTRPGAEFDSYYELLIAKFRLELKKVGKTTRSFRYNPNQIPYYCTVEVTNRFK